MTHHDRARIKQILDAALALPPAARDRYVLDACAGDAALAAEVRTLLSVYEHHLPQGTSEPQYSSPTTFAGDAISPVSPQEPVSPAAGAGAASTRWGSYVLVEELGRGGFGVVYRAWDPALRRDVAIKIIDVRRIPGVSSEAALREGQLMARVRHENVVTVHNVQPNGDEIGLVMEYVKGRTLAQIVAGAGPLSAHEAALVGMRLCDALTAVHRLGLVHRDLKASNVMRENGGRIVLMDFGAGRELAADRAVRHEILGTPAYMPPEVLLGSRGTPLSDIYSLGVLLYYLVTGTYPIHGTEFDELRMAHIGGERHLLAERRSDLPERYVAAVEKALAPEPSQRYASAVLFKRDLLDALPALPKPQRPRRPSAAEPTPAPVAPAPAPPQPGWLPRSAGPLQRLALSVAIVFLACSVIGFLTIVAFNYTLARTGDFASEPLSAYPVWGARAAVAPVGWFVITLLVVNALAFAGRLLVNVVPAVARPFRAVASAARRVIVRLGITNPDARMQALAFAGAIGLVSIAVGFRSLIAAFGGSIDDGSAGSFAMLSGDHYGMRLWYRRLLELLILAVGVPLIRAIRARQPADRPGAPTALAASAVIGLAALLLVAPYRLMFKATFPQVSVAGQTCYALGEHGADVLVHCPESSPPRNRILERTDPALRPLGRSADLFDAYAGTRHAR